MGPDALEPFDARAGRHHGFRPGRPRYRRARGHARHPPRGAPGAVLPRRPRAWSRVNVVGTVPLRGRKDASGTPIAWASSAAVYDRTGAIAPTTIYGVYKARERGTARIYWEESACQRRAAPVLRVRPGPRPGPDRRAHARDARRCARRAVRHPFGGRTELHYAPDVARAFVLAARSPAASPEVYDMPGEMHMSDVVSAIEAAAPEAEVTHGDEPLPFRTSYPGRRSRAGDAARGRNRRDDRAFPALDAACHPCLSRPIEATQQPVETEQPAGSGPLGHRVGFGIFIFIITFGFTAGTGLQDPGGAEAAHRGGRRRRPRRLDPAQRRWRSRSHPRSGTCTRRTAREKPMTGWTGSGTSRDHPHRPRDRVVREGSGGAEPLLGVQGRDQPRRNGGSFDGRTAPQPTHRGVALNRDARHLPAVLDLHHVRRGSRAPRQGDERHRRPAAGADSPSRSSSCPRTSATCTPRRARRSRSPA